MRYWSVDAAGNAEAQPHRLRQHRHDCAGDHGQRPAGRRPLRLAQRKPDGEPGGRRRHRLRCGRHLLHPRRRRPADLQRARSPSRRAGSHTIVYWSVDAAGNAEAHADRLRQHRPHGAGDHRQRTCRPTATPAGATQARSSVWPAATPCSGVAATYYTIDGGAQQTYSAPFTVSAARQPHDRLLVGRRGRQRRGRTTTGYVNIDLTAPATTATGLQADDTLRLAQRQPDGEPDGRRRIAAPAWSATYYTLDGGAQQTYGAPLLVACRGQPHDRLLVGRRGRQRRSPAQTGYVNIDLTAPATTATNLQADDHSGWRNASQIVSLAAGDDRLGRGHDLLHDRRRRPADLQRALHRLGGGQPHRSSTGRSTPPATPRLSNTGYVNIDLTAPTVSERRRRRLAQHRRHRHSEPGRRRRLRRGRHAVPPAGFLDLAGGGRQRLRRAGPRRRLRRRPAALPVPGPRRRRQRQRHRHLHREDRHPGAGGHADRPAGRRPLGLDGNDSRRSAWRPPTPEPAPRRPTTRSTAAPRRPTAAPSPSRAAASTRSSTGRPTCSAT